MICKGICIRHKAYKPYCSGRHVNGQKRCQICEIFIKWDGIFCSGCIGPRLFKHKAKSRITKQKEIRMQQVQNKNISNSIMHIQ